MAQGTNIYEVNGKPVSKAEYDLFTENKSTLPSLSKSTQQYVARLNNPSILGVTGDALASAGNRQNISPVSAGAIRDLGNIKPGAERQLPAPATQTTIQSLPGDSKSDNSKDMRVKIRVPSNYLTTLTQGSANGELSSQGFGGVIFPYTPTISLEHKADYSSQQPLHSNYAINFYKSSGISDITITGKFTVQNETEALIYLSTVRLLSALTKMRFGGRVGDSDSGAPPPVCRLDGYGEYSLKNVPIIITNFKHDLPDDVDYFTVGKNGGPISMTSVPTRSTLSVTCRVAYSRAEMQQISVTKYLDIGSLRGKGYL
jgi:hypothetical protein